MNQETIPREPLGAPTSRRRADTGLSALGALASLAAVLAAASCCVLPLALAALGLGAGLSSNFAALIPLRWPLTATSLIGLAAGWWGLRAAAEVLCWGPVLHNAAALARDTYPARDWNGSDAYRVRLGPPRSAADERAFLMQLTSTLTCPKCGGVATERMPTNACQFFYDCRHCAVVLRPLAGDCCVFCSFGDVPCPPIQEAKANGTVAGCCG